MKICLINPPNTYELVGNDPVIIKDQQGLYPPLGILYIAACLHNEGYEVKVIDAQVDDLTHAEVAEQVRMFNPGLVGMTAMTFTLVDCKKVVQEIRKVMRTTIVIGGPHTAIYPEECFEPQGLDADYVVVGEGEKTLIRLAQDIEMGRAKDKIYRQLTFIEDLNELPFPARELTPIGKYYSVLSEDTPTTTAFSCHDDQTEVLTETGFKPFSELCHTEKLITYHIPSGTMQVKPIKGITKEWFDGELIHFKNSTMDCMVTPNHRMMIQKRNEDIYTDFQFEHAEITSKTWGRQFTRFGEWIGDEPSDIKITFRTGNHQRKTLEIGIMDWLEFLGYYLSEGNSWFIRNNHNKPMYRVKITQSKEKNSLSYAKMESCIAKMGFNYYKNDTQFEISCKDLYEYLKPLGLCNQKYIPTYFKSLTRPYLRKIFDALIEGDGYINNTSTVPVYHYTTTSKRLAADVQEISLKLGYGSTVHIKKPRMGGYIKGRLVQSILPSYTVTSYNRVNLTTHGPQHSFKVPYKGYVYCAETENETLVTRRNGKVITLGNSRGCPFSCSYCDRPALGKGFRAMDATRVSDELEWCVNHGIKEVFFYDDTFSVSMKRVNEICNQIKIRKIKIKWDVRTRVNVVNEELLKNMKEAGCERIHFGVESGNPRVVKELQKGTSIEQVEKAFDLCKKYKIKTLAYFMMGNPTETMEDVLDTLNVSRRIKPDFMQMTILSPFPATQIYLRALQEGVVEGDPWRDYARRIHNSFRPPLYDSIYTRNELEKHLRWFYGKFYLQPSFIVDRVREVRNFGQFKRYASAGLSLLKMTLIPEQKIRDSWRTRKEIDSDYKMEQETAVTI